MPLSALRPPIAVLFVAATTLVLTPIRPAPGAPPPVPSAPIEAIDAPRAIMPALIERYREDVAVLDRFHDAPMSSAARERRRTLLSEWRSAIDAVAFEELDVDGRIDWLLLRNRIDGDLDALRDAERLDAEVAPLVPFAAVIVDLHEARRRVESLDHDAVAQVLADLARSIDEARESLATIEAAPSASVARRAAMRVDRLRRTLAAWFRFYDGYDPLASWWFDAPWRACDAALASHATAIRTELAGMTGDDDDETIIGDPVGRERLLELLKLEFIPYTPEELVAIADREYAWCLERMLAASNALGFGDDWRAALEHVKSLHVEPGAQPVLIREQVLEAVEFLERRDLLTIPPLAVETWRMDMMSPRRQKISPYFLGGETIIVSFPTDAMAHHDKLMSMRGNNEHFCRAVAHHEVIPGHGLQRFMLARHRPYRSIFNTPFWIEGWALYWEMRLWDLDFARGPEDEIGMLFWRMHRCARIRFSLAFHLGDMTAHECVDYLVENVGHERNNAAAEVRRSVSGDYGPLYQAAYMLGGLQIRALHREFVASGRMTETEFHDTILREHSIPIEVLRFALSDAAPSRDHATSWRFVSGDPTHSRSDAR